MTDHAIKAAVRKRDGYKCRDCGMTQEDHKEKFGTILEVHRLLPDVCYNVDSCIALCRTCHDKKPSRHAHVYYRNGFTDRPDWFRVTGVAVVSLSYYHEPERTILDRIWDISQFEEIPFEVAIDRVLEAGIAAMNFHPPIAKPPAMDFDLSELAEETAV